MKTNIKKEPIYGNCEVYSPDNILMFKCVKKRALWYVNKTNAEIISEEPLKVKLKFKPNGLGYHGDDYGLSSFKNCCVVCGTENELNRHHIVPTMFRKYMPQNYINHNFHDVVPICDTCHTCYEQIANKLKDSFYAEYNLLPKLDMDLFYVAKLAFTYKNIKTIPESRKNFIVSKLNDYIKKNNIELSIDECIDDLCNLKRKTITDLREIGKVILEKFNDNQKFVELWRTHFIENAKPKFMPVNWKIDREIYVR